MVMSAAALLKENANPSESEVRSYLEGKYFVAAQVIIISFKAIMAASGQDVSFYCCRIT